MLEPQATYIHGFQIDAICRLLEAVTRGEINRLLMNVPPGAMKSLLTSVFWPAWEWGPMGLRSMRYLNTAYNDGPVTRDSLKFRNLVLSEWYRTLWPEVVLVRKGETSMENTDTGTREGSAFGSLTAKRADRLIIDDPHSTETAESDVERENTTRRFREGALDRLNDQKRSAIVVIMQRLHQRDISGVILDEMPEQGFVHLCIPMRFETARKCVIKLGNGFHWEDPRTEEGELMAPDRWDAEATDKLETGKGEYAFAGQYQQRPAPREGGMFKVDKIDIVDHCPSGGETVSAWDLAGSKRKTSPYTARVLMTRVGGDIYVRDVKRWRADPTEVERIIERTCIDDRNEVPTVLFSLPQDPGYGGKAAKWRHAEILIGFNYKITLEGRDDKQTRAEPFSAQVGAERVHLVRGSWNATYIEELRNFPSGTYKDQVDASSRAFQELVKPRKRRTVGAPIHGDED